MSHKNGRGIAKICLIVIFSALLISSKAYSFPYKGLDISIEGTLSEMYDDNIELNDNIKKKDFITRLTLGMGIKYEGKTQTLDFMSQLHQDIFANYNNFNNTAGDFTLSFQKEFSTYDIVSLSNTFIYTFEPGSFEDEFSRTIGRNKSSFNKIEFFYLRSLSKQLSAVARYSNELSRVWGENTGGNSYQNSLGLTTNYIYSDITSFWLLYDFTKKKYKDTEVSFTQNVVNVGMKQDITKQLFLSGTAGVSFITNIFNDNINTGEYFKILLTDEISENITASLSLEKKEQAASFIEEVFDSWQTSGSFTAQISKRLGCSFLGFYGGGTYETSDITDRLLGANIGFTYEFTERVMGNLSYAYSQKESTRNPEYTKNIIRSGINLEF